jgi:tagatose 1,6-diphosphate aldolase
MNAASPIAVSPGRWRGLVSASTNEGSFAILAFDQRGNYRRLLREDATFEDAVAIKREVIEGLDSCVSGVLLDYVYGYDAAMSLSGTCGLLLALEETGYSGDATYRMTEFSEHWGAEKVRCFGASAAKLLVYYNPRIRDLADQIDQLVAETASMCHGLDLPLFVEPITYSADSEVSKNSTDFANMRPSLVIETAYRLSRMGADVLKVEFPVDTKRDLNRSTWLERCEELTQASTCPWTLLSAGVNFDEYVAQYEVASSAGASGFVAGRAVWKECVTMSQEQRERFLRDVASERLRRLTDLTQMQARRIHDYYVPRTAGEGWYERYQPQSRKQSD